MVAIVIILFFRIKRKDVCDLNPLNLWDALTKPKMEGGKNPFFILYCGAETRHVPLKHIKGRIYESGMSPEDNSFWGQPRYELKDNGYLKKIPGQERSM